MKKLSVFTLIAIGLLFFTFNGKAQNEDLSDTKLNNKVEVIGFHSTHRCMTCKAIEANTKYTLDEFFADELKSGKIIYQSINIDEKENYAMAEKFQAGGTSLFLNLVDSGKESQIDLTNLAFKKGKDYEKVWICLAIGNDPSYWSLCGS